MRSRKSVGVALAVAVAAGLPVAAANAAPAQDSGTLRLSGWFDTNRDGARDNGEQAIADFRRLSISGGGEYYSPQPRQDSIELPAGKYIVTVEGYVSTTPHRVEVDVPAGGSAEATFGMVGRTVSGIAWQDANTDGIRQPGEARAPGRWIRSDQQDVRTDASGRYTLHNVASVGVWTDKEADGRPVTLGPSQQAPGQWGFPDDADSDVDSDFEAGSHTMVGMGSVHDDGTAPFEHVDLAVAPGPYDQSIAVHSDQDWGNIKQGSTFEATVTVRGESGVPAARAVEIVSDGTGLVFDGVDGHGWTTEMTEGKHVVRVHPDAAVPVGGEHKITVRFSATGETNGEPTVYFRLVDQDANGPVFGSDEVQEGVGIV